MDKQKRKIILAACFLIVVMCVAVAPAMASTLKIDSAKLTYLQKSDVWSPYNGYTFLAYHSPGIPGVVNQQPIFFGSHIVSWITAPNGIRIPVYSWDFIADQVGNPWGSSYGLCTDFVESVCSPAMTTGKWYTYKSKNKVMGGNVAPGTAISTFNFSSIATGDKTGDKGVYTSKSGLHSVIFSKYVTNGFEVYDQSFYDGYDVVAKHLIMAGGSVYKPDGKINNGNANNYYVVQY